MRSPPRPERRPGRTEPPDAEDAGAFPLWGGARPGTSPRRAAGFPGAFLGNPGGDLELGPLSAFLGNPRVLASVSQLENNSASQSTPKAQVGTDRGSVPWLQARVQGTRAGAGISGQGGRRWALVPGGRVCRKSIGRGCVFRLRGGGEAPGGLAGRGTHGPFSANKGPSV